MRSEHNGGASLAAFLLAVSTVTLLFVFPVEGQWTSCSTNADCPPTEPYCNVPDVPTAGRCGECLVTAFSYEPGSCPATDDQGNPLLCLSGQCESCESAGLSEVAFCYRFEVDQKRNCLRDCFDDYVCTTNADCPAHRPTCDILLVLTRTTCALPSPCNISSRHFLIYRWGNASRLNSCPNQRENSNRCF